MEGRVRHTVKEIGRKGEERKGERKGERKKKMKAGELEEKTRNESIKDQMNKMLHFLTGMRGPSFYMAFSPFDLI